VTSLRFEATGPGGVYRQIGCDDEPTAIDFELPQPGTPLLESPSHEFVAGLVVLHPLTVRTRVRVCVCAYGCLCLCLWLCLCLGRVGVGVWVLVCVVQARGPRIAIRSR
jgi:hypothetical protein